MKFKRIINEASSKDDIEQLDEFFGLGGSSDYEVGAQSYPVKDVMAVEKFVDDEIGLEYEVDLNYAPDTIEYHGDRSGEVVVYDLMNTEHKKIRSFLDDNDLWDK